MGLVMNKKNVFFGVAAAMFGAVMATAAEVEMLRTEDEALLQPQQPARPIQFSKPFYMGKITTRRALQPESFDEQPVHPVQAVMQKRRENEDIRQIRLRINDCLTARQEKLEMERNMYGQLKTPESLAYLAETMEEVNLCYEDIGLEIIGTYYGNDERELAAFEKKIPDFYVNGTGLNFDPKFCGETCSMSAVFDAQVEKYADFRVYLSKLLDGRPQEN